PTVEMPGGGAHTLTGPSTRIAAVEAQQQVAAGRRRYLAAAFADGAVPEAIPDEDSSSGILVLDEESPSGAASASGPHTPADFGDLKTVPAIRVLHRIARSKQKGLLVLEGRAGILKEAYFADGHPQFVSSNVQSERFGDYLVAQGAITPQQLARAVAAM